MEPLILARWVHFAATATAAGTVLFLPLVAAPALQAAGAAADGAAFTRRCRLLVWAALLLAIGSGAVWLVWLAADITGASLVDVCLHGGALTVLSETRFGLVAMIRLALALLLGALMLWPATRLLQMVAGAALIGTLAWIGHAGASPGAAGAAHLAADVLHLIAAGAWLGALPAFALLLAMARRAETVGWNTVAAVAARRFSPLGIASVGTLMATGLANAWNLLSGPRDLVATEYGRLLALKLGLFAAMIGFAAVNRFHFTPQLPRPTALRALQRNSLAEIALGLGVLLFVAAMGTMAPPVHDHVHLPAGPIDPQAAYVHIHTETAMADVSITPGRAGPARAAILLLQEDFTPFTAKAVTLLLTPRALPGVASISSSAIRQPDGSWTVDRLALGAPGIWVVKLTVTPEAGAPFVLDAPIVIDR
jgi:putative copper resistance protein D